MASPWFILYGEAIEGNRFTLTCLEQSRGNEAEEPRIIHRCKKGAGMVA